MQIGLYQNQSFTRTRFVEHIPDTTLHLLGSCSASELQYRRQRCSRKSVIQSCYRRFLVSFWVPPQTPVTEELENVAQQMTNIEHTVESRLTDLGGFPESLYPSTTNQNIQAFLYLSKITHTLGRQSYSRIFHFLCARGESSALVSSC